MARLVGFHGRPRPHDRRRPVRRRAQRSNISRRGPGAAPPRGPRSPEPGPTAGSPRRCLPQDRSGGRAVADRAQSGRPSDARRWRDGRVPSGGRVDRGRAGSRDRLRRSGQQRLAGGQPVHGGGDAGAQPAGRHRDLRQRAAARGDRAEEPGRREGHDRRGAESAPDIPVADPGAFRLQLRARHLGWHGGADRRPGRGQGVVQALAHDRRSN